MKEVEFYEYLALGEATIVSSSVKAILHGTTHEYMKNWKEDAEKYGWPTPPETIF